MKYFIKVNENAVKKLIWRIKQPVNYIAHYIVKTYFVK